MCLCIIYKRRRPSPWLVYRLVDEWTTTALQLRQHLHTGKETPYNVMASAKSLRELGEREKKS